MEKLIAMHTSSRRIWWLGSWHRDNYEWNQVHWEKQPVKHFLSNNVNWRSNIEKINQVKLDNSMIYCEVAVV